MFSSPKEVTASLIATCAITNLTKAVVLIVVSVNNANSKANQIRIKHSTAIDSTVIVVIEPVLVKLFIIVAIEKSK
jgi:NaMN:DMB phosphoribosyltransferase